MQVSTKLFNEQSIDRFSKLNSDIQTLQAKIATGKNVLRASDDPVAMINISAAKEKLNQLERYNVNIDRAVSRLSQAEIAISDIQSVVTRIYELSIQVKNDTYNSEDKRAISLEMKELKQQIIGIANSADANGNTLFSGFSTNKNPFYEDDNSKIIYDGDQGNHQLAISESMKISTSINGAEVFMRVKSGDNYNSIFDTIDETIQKIDDNDTISISLTKIKDSISHLSNQVTKIGSNINRAETQQQNLNNRILNLTNTVSGIEDTDIASVVTELQSQLVSRDAAQQTFMMINQTNLFDYVR